MDKLKVSFVVIALNAGKTIDTVFDCLARQSYPHEDTEIILVDGLSTDDTKEKMILFSRQDHGFARVAVLDNPGKTLPCGWNVALKDVRGDAVLRVDAHTSFPEDFIALNVRDLNRGENICGGKVISIPAEKTPWSIMLNEAENSMFGGSFAAFRHADSERYVSTAAFAMYRKSVFDEVGPYNEELARTEDNEMHYRMKKAGYRFFYDPQIVSYRETRATLPKLLKQKYLNGYWIGRTLGVEPRCFSAYHFVPFAFVAVILVTAIMACCGMTWAAVLLWGAYLLANLAMTAAAFPKVKSACGLLLPVVFLLLHLSYGAGTAVGIAGMICRKIRKH